MGGRRRVNAKTLQLSAESVPSEPKAEPKASVEEQIRALHKRQEADLAKLLAQKLQPSIVVSDHNSAVSSAATNSAKPAATNLPNGPLVKDSGPILISKLEEAGFEDSKATKSRAERVARQQASKDAISAGISQAASKQDTPKSLKLPPIALPANGWSNSKGDPITPSPPITAPDPGMDCVVGPTSLDTAAKWLEISSQSPHAIAILVFGREAPDLGIFPRALQSPLVLRCSRPGTMHISMQSLYLIQAGAQNVAYSPLGTGSAPILNLDTIDDLTGEFILIRLQVWQVLVSESAWSQALSQQIQHFQLWWSRRGLGEFPKHLPPGFTAWTARNGLKAVQVNLLIDPAHLPTIRKASGIEEVTVQVVPPKDPLAPGSLPGKKVAHRMAVRRTWYEVKKPKQY